MIDKQEFLRFFIATFILFAGACSSPSAALANPVGYQFDGIAFYQFSDPVDLSPLALYHANPDTSFFRITNNGTSTFTGNIGQVAVSAAGPDFSFLLATSLAPGESIALSTSDESSNYSGFNGAFDDPLNPQNGIQILMQGTVTFNGMSEAVDLSIFDKDIHSGVSRVNPFGVEVDNYILQGGDPLGRDTLDDFEVSQAPGEFQFLKVVVPEPSALALIAWGLLSGLARRRFSL